MDIGLENELGEERRDLGIGIAHVSEFLVLEEQPTPLPVAMSSLDSSSLYAKS